MQKIKIKYFTDKIEPMDYIEGKSDWIDMRASEEVTLKAGEFALIPLGVAMELPKGYEAHLVPRSSTFKNWGIIQTNSVGIVDGSYCGDNDMWRMPVYATRDTVIHVNDRIAQFRIVENQPEIVFEKVEHLTGKDLETEFGYSFDHMNRRFKTITGENIFNYLMKSRINQAKVLLYTKKISVTQVAEMTGFCNIYHFSKMFRKFTGMTPTEYVNYSKTNPSDE